MNRRYRTSCEHCGWTSKPAKTPRLALRGLQLHSCELRRRRDAARARWLARAAAVDRTPKPCRHKQARHVHGTYACYVLDRCRCGPCSRANTGYESDRTRAQAYGRWDGLVDAEPARAHVRELAAAGMGLKRVAAVSGVAHGVLWGLMYGKRRPDDTRVPSQRIRPATAGRLLAARLDLADGARVNPLGATRRIQALVALGWSQSQLATRLGRLPSNFTPTIHGRRPITAAHDRAIRGLYEQLSMTVPPETTHRQRIAASRARNHARRVGWAPPLGWDDERIDDPAATSAAPETDSEWGVDEMAVERRMSGDTTVQLTRAERWTAIEHLNAAGLSDKKISRQLGISDRQVLRVRQQRLT
ncbi:MAG: hypothetical protein ACRD0W_07970 [Acidimicrobiales bacterium]